jgi:hypothetical protein
MKHKKLLVIIASIVVLSLIGLSVWYLATSIIKSNKANNAKEITKLVIASDFESFAFERDGNSTPPGREEGLSRLIQLIQAKRDSGELRRTVSAKTKSLEDKIVNEFWKGAGYLKEYATPDPPNSHPTFEGVKHLYELRLQFYASFDRLAKLIKEYGASHKKPGFDTQKLWDDERRTYGTVFNLAEFDKWWKSN